MKQFIVLVAVVYTVALTARAGTPVMVRNSLTRDGARKIIAAAVAEAQRLNAPGAAIAVVDEGGNLMMVERLDNTFAAGALISIGKARTAALFKKPTSVFEKIIRDGRTPMIALNDFTPLQGGVPVEIDGKIVGAVGVSGASSARQDEELAIAGAKALAGADMPEAVALVRSEAVAEAFRKGMPLLENGHYKVHASHRDGAGEAEIHQRDTDIIYVIEGTATFVTGGTVPDGKTIGPDEVRGSAIRNGETRTLSQGDVVVVPSGTPHWFTSVTGPFNYYVVKVAD